MANVKGVTRHTWDGADPEKSEEYQRQVAMDVHYATGEFEDGGFEKIDSLTGLAAASGELRFVHKTACGLITGTAILRTTDTKADVTCADCKARSGKRR